MQIGIIGVGNIGSALARLFARAGHPVMISNSRGPESLAGLVAELGAGVQAGTIADAAAFGELAVEAIPFSQYRSLPPEPLAGKILITASNYVAERDGPLDLAGRAHSELVAERLPSTRVVKAFGTIWVRHLETQGDLAKPLEERRAIFLAGDDPAAKRLVAGLVEEIGFAPYDLGALHASRQMQPDGPLFNNDLTLDAARRLLNSDA